MEEGLLELLKTGSCFQGERPFKPVQTERQLKAAQILIVTACTCPLLIALSAEGSEFWHMSSSAIRKHRSNSFSVKLYGDKQ